MDKKVLFEALNTELAKENKMSMPFIKKMPKSEALLRKLVMISE